MTHEDIVTRLTTIKYIIYPPSMSETAIENRKYRGTKEKPVRVSRQNLKDYISLAFLYGMKEKDIIEEVTQHTGIDEDSVKFYVRICKVEMSE